MGIKRRMDDIMGMFINGLDAARHDDFSWFCGNFSMFRFITVKVSQEKFQGLPAPTQPVYDVTKSACMKQNKPKVSMLHLGRTDAC